MWWDVVVCKVLAAPHLGIVVGCSVLAVGVVADSQPLGIAGLVVTAVALAVLLSNSTWVRVDAERQRARTRVGARDREPTTGGRATVLSLTPPEIEAHVLDGTRPPLSTGQILVIPLAATALLFAGVAALASDLVVVGFVSVALGLCVVGTGLGLVSSTRRHGLTWGEMADRAWPEGYHPGEIVDVWVEDTPGFPRAHGFWLRVQALDRTWEVRTRQAVPQQWVSALRPGLPVTVRVHPDDSHRVPIDWSVSPPPT